MSKSDTWEQRLKQDRRRVIILDDDPTGTQSVANVEVILRPALPAYRRFFSSTERAVYVLSNTRALKQETAVDLLRRIRAEVEQAAHEAGEGVSILLRGDSTLRGHVFAEMDVLAEGVDDAVLLFVPAFPDGGRVTINGVHYLLNGDEKTPVAQTEFARDATFAYHSLALVDWVAEVGQGRTALSLPLSHLRSQGAAALRQVLLEAPAGTVVVPDAETNEDLEMLARGLLDAEEGGRRVIVRSASPFAALRAGLRPAFRQPALSGQDNRVLVVCGSHTEASTRQLASLEERTTPVITVPIDWLLNEGLEGVVPHLAVQVNLALEERRFAILATERTRQPRHSDLAAGAQVMAALTAIVARVAGSCDAVIAKGGITAAQVATDGLAATRAVVQGQLEAGVPLWNLTLADGRTLPYAVIPGNVGHEHTLVNVATQFQAAPLKATARRTSPMLQPIEQKSLVAEITQRLLDYLLSGEIKPGSRLPSERQLSEALGMGRSTLRESLKALTLLGLLEVRQGDGTYLKKADSVLLPRIIEWGLLLGEQRTMDLIEARQKIEVIIAELATRRRDYRAIEELRKIMQRLQQAGADYQEFVDADVAFHLKLAEIARNTVLRDILSSIQALLRAWIIRVIESAGTTDFSYREHLAIFEAVERGDARAAAEAMQAHMDSARRRLILTITKE
ncbi:MAG TPA: four-carbon acid sugar kinase family protein [Ktedonobacteraceae bacterium]|nr:four-carbon acid sugar kinase family protein [Ktedonobacteraceae bacterium]